MLGVVLAFLRGGRVLLENESCSSPSCLMTSRTNTKVNHYPLYKQK